MKAKNIVALALPYVGQTPEDSEDLLALALPMMNLALQEVLEVENGIRRYEKREELNEAPWLDDLETEVPYAAALTRRALPYWLAYRFLQDDDLDGRASYYYHEYINALREAQKLVPESVVDVYA